MDTGDNKGKRKMNVSESVFKNSANVKLFFTEQEAIPLSLFFDKNLLLQQKHK